MTYNQNTLYKQKEQGNILYFVLLMFLKFFNLFL